MNNLKKTSMENKFKEGDIVVERTRPSSRLIVTRCDGSLYYCKDVEFSKRKVLVYFDRDLKIAEAPVLTVPSEKKK